MGTSPWASARRGSRSARKRRLDCNRQAAAYASRRAAQPVRPTRTALDVQRSIAAAVDPEHPERSLDMEALDDMRLLASHGGAAKREAAATLNDSSATVEARVSAAVQLMVGRDPYQQWTVMGRQRTVCCDCGRKYALRADGFVRRHVCVSE